MKDLLSASLMVSLVSVQPERGVVSEVYNITPVAGSCNSNCMNACDGTCRHWCDGGCKGMNR